MIGFVYKFSMPFLLFFIHVMFAECLDEIKLTNETHETLIIDKIFPYKNSLKPIISANYSSPGPTIEVNEGDILVIRVINKLDVPSVLHWHGIYQLGTPEMDGTPGFTQCAIPPRGEMIYRFKAEPAGTTWYHGHLLEQYTDGLYGPLIIHSKSNSKLKEFGRSNILMVSDWYNQQANAELLPLYLSSKNPEGYEPLPDAIVVNGKFTQTLVVTSDNSSKILFRVINSAAFSMFTISIDGLPLHIVELDQQETLPYSVTSFNINVAQRVSFFIDLNQLDTVYTNIGELFTRSVFIRFQATISMYPVDITNYVNSWEDQRYPYPVFFNPLYLAILSLDSTNSTPTYPASEQVPLLQNVMTPIDTNLLDARPAHRNIHSIPNATHYLNVLIEFKCDVDGINRGFINNVTYRSAANYMSTHSKSTDNITSDRYVPLLHQMIQKLEDLGIPEPRLEKNEHLSKLQSNGFGHYLVPYQAVVDVYLNNTDDGEHPFHLHGHQFWIIATSEHPSAEFVYHGNYLQRDVVNVPASGWAKIRFVANNPGAWFFHCHIDWHMSAGLGIAFLTSTHQFVQDGYKVPKSQKELCHALYEYDMDNSILKHKN